MRETNAFYRLGRDDENAVTELLCNLMENTVVRNAVLQTFGISQEIIKSVLIGSI